MAMSVTTPEGGIVTSATRALPAIFDDSATSWERATYAFLAEKERRSGSRRTVESSWGAKTSSG